MKIKLVLTINLLIVAMIASAIIGGFVYVIHNTDYSLAAEVTEDVIPPKIDNVVISDITATSCAITWGTDELADSLVNYGLNKNYGISRDPHFDKISHKIILEDLLPNTIYYYRITSSDASGNQGISSDFSFNTSKEKEEEDKTGFAEQILTEGKGGLYKEGEQEVLKYIEQVVNEEILEKIESEVKERAQEIAKPPAIMLDSAKVEVGTDWARIPWKTDKEANSIVALAAEANYHPEAENPYTWKEGEPNEMVTDHIVEVNGLSPSTIYHFQVSSESAIGLMGISEDITFKTKSILPEISNIQILKVEEESATIRWMTNIPCSAIIEYSNLNTQQTKLEGNSSFMTAHSIRLTNLVYDTYYSVIIRVESEDGEKAESDPLTFITTKDQYPPIIAKVNTESTLYPGTENKVQTIVSWVTDEQSLCQLFYGQGLAASDKPLLLPKEQDIVLKHVQVVTNFLPATVYRFWIVCDDETGNSVKSEYYTMLTPSQEQSIIDIILKNFESSFGWVKKLRGGN